EDLRRDAGGERPIEQTGCRAPAEPVLMPSPPEHAFAARLVEPGRAARHAEADVQRAVATGDEYVQPVEDRAAGRRLGEAEVDEGAQEVARLRRARPDRPADVAGYRVVAPGRLAQEGDEVAHRGEADAEHRRVLGRVAELVGEVGVEAAFDADALR